MQESFFFPKNKNKIDYQKELTVCITCWHYITFEPHDTCILDFSKVLMTINEILNIKY